MPPSSALSSSLLKITSAHSVKIYFGFGVVEVVVIGFCFAYNIFCLLLEGASPEEEGFVILCS